MATALETSILSENFRMPVGQARGMGVSHAKPLYYYFGILIEAVLPLLPLLPALIEMRKSPFAEPSWRHLGAWIASGFLLFEAVASKRMHYLLPLQAAVAAWIGLAVDRCLAGPDSRFLKAGSLGVGVLLVLASIATLILGMRAGALGFVRDRSVQAALQEHRLWVEGAGLGMFAAGAALLLAFRRGPEAAVNAAAAFAILVMAIRFGVGSRLEVEFERTRPFVAEMVPKLAGQVPVILPPIRGYSLDYYWPSRLVRDEKAPGAARVLLVARGELERISPPYETLGIWKYGPNGRDDILLIRRRSSP